MNKILNECYTVGALLYSPAINTNIPYNIKNEIWGKKYSLCLCLEDSINDDAVEIGEENIVNIFSVLNKELEENTFFMPKIFIRVRNPFQISKLFHMLKNNSHILTGFVAPKFSIDNADEYIKQIENINKNSDKKIYIMPIIENGFILYIEKRAYTLYKLKQKLDNIHDLVLNIRIGGNDICHNLGLRRNKYQTIYDISSINNILGDIYTVFGREYVISSVVWDYFSGSNDQWKKGLEKELEIDILNGFIGKTAIHPNQIPIINEALKVSKTDYNDAKSILNWDMSENKLVSKSTEKERMNEIKTHSNWAKKIIILGDYYGIK